MRWRGGLLAAGFSLLLLTPSVPEADVGVVIAGPVVQAEETPAPEAPPQRFAANSTEIPQAALARARTCAKKRTDACGCHHYFGVRHCHAKLKTDKCQRRVERQPFQHEAQKKTWVAQSGSTNP